MNDLIVPWGDDEKLQFEQAFISLLRLKDRRMSEKALKETATLYAEELSHHGIHIKPMLNGLHKLKFEATTRLSLDVIIEAAEEVIIPTEFKQVDCDHCFSSGYVSMRNEAKYEFALSCICTNGERPGPHSLRKWNGQKTQDSKNGVLTKRF